MTEASDAVKCPVVSGRRPYPVEGGSNRERDPNAGLAGPWPTSMLTSSSGLMSRLTKFSYSLKLAKLSGMLVRGNLSKTLAR